MVSMTSANRPRLRPRFRRTATRFPWLMLALGALTAAILMLWPPVEARAFCGFYVGRADAQLYNHASQVVMVHDGDRTVLSLMNDYQGEPEEFALVIPVPMVLQQGQIHIGNRELFQRIDSYSAPRLVEYYDPSPCPLPMSEMQLPMNMAVAGAAKADLRAQDAARALGVTVEAQYTVGEYDIVILSATQSDGLETWLQQTGYHIPEGLGAALAPYIRQGMKFFVARVNLKEHQRTGLSYLRPIQFAFESPKFMLPIRLGMINANGPQDLIVYVLSREGRVETTDYRTVKMPSGMDVPEFLQGEFGKFYQAMFDQQVKRDEMRTVFTEYVWNMGWCDPCAAPPLSPDELRALGVFWLDDNSRGELAARNADDESANFADAGARPDAGDPDPPACALLGGNFSRGPDVSADAGPGKFPGALRHPPSVDRITRRMRGRARLFRGTQAPARNRRRHARRSDRMGPRGRPQTGRAEPRGSTGAVVGTVVGNRTELNPARGSRH